MSAVNPSSRESTVSHEDWDHLTPNLLDDNDEALAAEHNSFRQRRIQTQLRPDYPPSLRYNDPSRTSHHVLQDDATLQVTTQLANIMRSNPTLHKTFQPSYRPQDASSQHEHDISSYRQRKPLHRSINSNATTTEGSRIVVAIDYGTTYTGFALAKTQSDHADLNNIEVLQNWGSSGNANNQKVRTMISYVKSSNGETQWGSNISDHATAMINTKLELEPQTRRFDELELTLYLLRGTGNLAFEHLKKIGPNPAYSSAPPKQIVQDYLTHIRESACKPNSFRDVDMTRLGESNTPLDVVVTVPANWSHQATDATFKAIRGAGFNRATFPNLHDTVLVSEPEAAAFFAIRDHQNTQNVNLRVDDCFILCDAGGGTVDVVSYQVKKVTPHLELERATEPRSGKCGSVFIDTAFKNWLRDILGVENYGKLDRLNARNRINAHTSEDGPIRKLVENFVIKKHAFSSTSQDVRIDLPEPLNALDVEDRVRQGELTIHRAEMEELFSDCVNGVIELLDDQIERVRKAKQRRARDVFLVGGFGASQYLQEQLIEALDLANSTLRRPDSEKSLTAVVQGAVIYGIEKSRLNGVRYMSAITESYAIVLDGRFEWLIRKGDLVLSTEKRRIHSKYFSLPLEICPSRKYEMVIYAYKKRNEDDDDVPSSWDDGRHDVEIAGVVKCDFSTMIERELRLHPSHERQGNMELGPFRCYLQLSDKSLEVEVLLHKTALGRCTIGVKTDSPSTVPENDWNY